VGGQHHAPAALAPGKRPNIHGADSTASPEESGKYHPPSGFNPQTCSKLLY